MSIVKPIEKVDQIICKKHNSKIVLLSLEERSKELEKNLLCITCIEEQTKVPQSIPWKDMKATIQEDQEKYYQQFTQSINPIIQLIEDFKESAEKIKEQLNTCLQNIMSTASLWIQEIQKCLSEGASYSLFQELDLFINKQKNNELYSIDKKRRDSIIKCNLSYLNKLSLKFKQFYSSQESIKFVQTKEKIFEFFQQKTFDKLNEALMQSGQQLFTSTFICPKHNVPIIMINITKGAERGKRTLCVNCDMQNIQNMISTSMFEERWKAYQNNLSLTREAKCQEISFEISQIKDKITLMKTQIMKDIFQFQVLLDNRRKINLQFIKNNHSDLKQDQIKVEQLQIMAEELSQNENNKETQQDKKFEEQNKKYSQQLALQFQEFNKNINAAMQDLIIYTTQKKIIENKNDNENKIEDKKDYKKEDKDKIDDNNNNIKEIEQKNEIEKKNELPEQIKPEPNIKQNIVVKQITPILVDEIKQEEWCYAIAFNSNGTILATGCYEKIRIWQIENGRLKATGIVLTGHSDSIFCLVFSKKINTLFSAGEDKAIRCWKETTQNNWVSSQPVIKHTYSVLCLLLNKKEDQLLSSSADGTIKVWKVDGNKNEISYSYSLDNHTSMVRCISMSESENTLVSCSSDYKIIIWGKGQQYKWEFLYYIAKSVEDFGQRISFINNNMIAWQQYSKAITHIFELENGVFKERPQLQITLNQAGYDGAYLFPSIYNSKQKVLIQRHNEYVYIIRQQQNGQFKIESEPINCNNQSNYGGLTECGQYLVIWNGGTLQLRFYKINYE